MAIAEDASSPAVATGTGTTGTVATGSFSPPANSMLVAMACGQWGTVTATASITDSVGGAWTTGAQIVGTGATFFGIAGVYYRYLSSAPGAMTVTATFTNMGGGRYLLVKVLTGTDTALSGAGTGAIEHGTASTALTVGVTTARANSWVYGLASDNGGNNTLSAASGSTLLSPFQNATDNVACTGYKSATVIATASAGTYGATIPTADWNIVAGLEIFAAVAGGATPAPRPIQLRTTAAVQRSYLL